MLSTFNNYWSGRKQCQLVDLYVNILFGLGPEGSTTVKAADSGRLADGNSPGISGITVDKSVEFTYEELATATNDFSIANKIGQGGFGAEMFFNLTSWYNLLCYERSEIVQF